VFGILGGIGLGRLWCLGRCQYWSSLAASVLGVFGVLGGVGVGRLWCLGRRRYWASWGASVLFTFGGVGIGRLGYFWRLGHLGLGRLLWVFRRLGARRSWSSLASWASLSVLVLGVFGLGVYLGVWVFGVLGVIGVFESLVSWASLVLGLWSLERLLACWPSLAS
jgi:hypothetical protein